ncbi:hypothetical protein C0995_003295, partial [Termitomyces sp. Mi166
MSNLHKIQLDNTTTPKLSEFAGITSTEFFKYQGFMADIDTTEDFKTSINWNKYSAPHFESILATTVIAPLNQAEQTPLVLLTEKPFYVDSGVT